MRKILFLLSGVLGMLLSTSCGAAYYAGGYYEEGNGRASLYQSMEYPQYCRNDIYYRNSRLTYDGTRIVGDKGYPTGLIWRNASMQRRGMIVTFYDANQRIIAQYDLRVPRQNVDDCFRVTGLTGKALEVWVIIKGGRGSTNYITVSDGEEERIYNLRRE